MDLQEFWNAISILINNYHTVNRKICACVINEVRVKPGVSNEDNTVDKDKLFSYLKNVSEVPAKCSGFEIDFKCLHKKSKDAIHATGIVGKPATKIIHKPPSWSS